MSLMVVVSIEVADFDHWKSVFDDNSDSRERVGIHVDAYTQVGEPNKVTVIGTTPSVEVVQSFFSDPEQQAKMKEAGSLGKPEIKFLQKR